METSALLSLLQLSDSFFPCGGFAHSFGLESLVQEGSLCSLEELTHFVREVLTLATAPAEGVCVARAHALGVEKQDELGRFSKRYETMETLPELRAASLQMGRETLRVILSASSSALSSRRKECLFRLWSSAQRGALSPHYPIVFGALSSLLDIPLREAVVAYLYGGALRLFSAGLRLLSIGQVAVQAELASLFPLIAQLAEEIVEAKEEEPTRFAPGLFLASSRHQAAQARLFRS